MEEVQRTYAKFDKERLKRGMDRKEKGFDLEVGIQGLPCCVKTREVGKRKTNFKKLIS